MDNNHPEAITIQIGDRERTLKVGPAAFRIAEIRHKIVFTLAELSAPTMATLARMAYVGCLPDDPKLKEIDFLMEMANSDEGKILAAVGRSLTRMTEGLSGLQASGDEGNGKAGKK